MLPRRSRSVCSGHRFGRAKGCPRKHRQAQVDAPKEVALGHGAGIQSVDRLLQIDTKGLLGIKTTGDSNERLSQVGVDARGPGALRRLKEGEVRQPRARCAGPGPEGPRCAGHVRGTR